MKNILSTFILFLLFQQFVFAQKYIDILNIGYTQNGDSQYQGFDNEFSQKTFWLNANLPLKLNKTGDLLIPSFSYNWLELNNDFYADDELKFQSIDLGIGYLKHWKNPYWANYIDAWVGTTTNDFSAINGDYLNFSTTLLFYYGKSNDLIWKFGGNYVSGSFGNWVVPMIGVDWSINEQLNLSFLSFSHFQLDYQFSKRASAGLLLTNSAYNLNLSDYFGIKNSVVYSYSEDFPYAPQKLAAYIDWYLSEKAVIFGRIGYEFSREIFHQDFDGNFIDESAYNGKIDAGLVFEFGVAWRKFLK